MPRININEKDRTSPGTPGGYSNNTVLIAGFSAYSDKDIKDNAKAVQADDNGIFEFESSDDFVATIGLVAPAVHATNDENDDNYEAALPEHYGNQMAYELLKMGYPVIYINLGLPYETDEDGNVTFVAAQKMKKLGDFKETWEIFKDKASYDFRFISHGLLTSREFAKSDDLVNFEKRVAKMKELFQIANEDLVRFDELRERDEKELSKEELEELKKFREMRLEGVDGSVTSGGVLTDDQVVIELQKAALAKLQTVELDFVYKDSAKAKYTDAAKAINYTTLIFDVVKTYEDAEDAIDEQEGKVKDELDKAKTASGVFVDSDFAAANAAIAKLAHYKAEVASDGSEDEMAGSSGRGDCVALIEIDEAMYIFGKGRPENRIVNAIKKMSDINADNGKYCTCTVPSVVYNMTADERFAGNMKFPGAFHYLACFKNSLGLGFAEWYAAAGYTRGVSSYVVDHTTVKLGEIAIQALEPRNIKDQAAQPQFAVNVIANFRGSYYLWGNRTCHPLGDAKG
jgi:hypothetical protein